MSVGRIPTTTERYGARIITVDPANRLVHVLFRGDERQVLVPTTPIAFRWPVVGEDWLIRNENGTWYLDSPFAPMMAPTTIEEIAPGNAVINSTTGIVHILGSHDGTTDYTMVPSYRGTIRLVGGTATVAVPYVTDDSLIFLTAQDNLTIGALRISARTAGSSFIITSSDGTDGGLVAWQLQNNILDLFVVVTELVSMSESRHGHVI